MSKLRTELKKFFRVEHLFLNHVLYYVLTLSIFERIQSVTKVSGFLLQNLNSLTFLNQVFSMFKVSPISLKNQIPSFYETIKLAFRDYLLPSIWEPRHLHYVELFSFQNDVLLIVVLNLETHRSYWSFVRTIVWVR
jgi:hypothetical protein